MTWIEVMYESPWWTLAYLFMFVLMIGALAKGLGSRRNDRCGCRCEKKA